MKILHILATAILIVSCNSEQNVQNVPDYNIQKYYFKYMDYPDGIAESVNSDNAIQIEYDNNLNVSKRIGSYRSMDPGSGFNFALDNQIYDQVTRSNNEVFIEQKTTSNIFSIFKFERKLFFNNQNQIIKKTIFRELPTIYYPQRDTILFTYDINGKIIETNRGRLTNINEKVKLYYNSVNNLDSIVSKIYIGNNIVSKTIEKFSNYDSSINTIKKLFIFEETYARSLSKNNFQTYEKKIYERADNELTYESYKNWNLIYDSNGLVKFETN